MADTNNQPQGEERWLIPHPGTGETVVCKSFTQAMYKYFEGFNIPRKVILEPMSESYLRVNEYMKLPLAQKLKSKAEYEGAEHEGFDL